MSIWGKLGGAAAGFVVGGPLGALAGAALGAIIDLGIDQLSPGRTERRQVLFTIAAIALAAKTARADGYASPEEFNTFQQLFQVAPEERDNVNRFYSLAKQSTDGYEAYARQAASLLGAGSPLLEDLLDALFLIALTDGVKPSELAYLDHIAELFGFAASEYARIRARHVAPSADDPYVVLGVAPGASAADIRRAYRELVKRYHPDVHIAEGMPMEFIRVAEARMAAINEAYDQLRSRA